MIKMTMQEVLHGAIEQIEHLQGAITELTQEPCLKSTDSTVKMLEDVIASKAGLITVELNESEYTKPLVMKSELRARLYNLVNAVNNLTGSFDASTTPAVDLALTEARDTLSKIIK